MKRKENIAYRKLTPFIIMLNLLFITGAAAFCETNILTVVNNYQENNRIVVTYPENEDDRLFCGRVEGIIQAPREAVWKVLNDFDNYCEFFPRMAVAFIVAEEALEEICLVETRDKKIWKRSDFEILVSKYRIDKPVTETFYFYNVIDMPFPLTDRWLLYKVKFESEEYSVSWSMVYGNMLISEGSWELTPVGRNSAETLAVYNTFSKSMIPIPAFILNLGFQKTLPDIIKGLRKRTFEMAHF